MTDVEILARKVASAQRIASKARAVRVSAEEAAFAAEEGARSAERELHDLVNLKVKAAAEAVAD